MLDDVSPKPYQGEVTHRGMGGPQGAIIDGLLDIIELQSSLYDAYERLKVSVISDGMKADLRKFKALDRRNGQKDAQYRERLDHWHRLVADALERKDKRPQKEGRDSPR